MNNDDEIRWRQIFENYEKAFNELIKHKNSVFDSKLEKAGYIHYFEITLHFAEKVMFAYLDAKGKSVETPRQAVRELAKLGIVQNQQIWFKIQNRRNLSLYIHKNEKLFDELLTNINNSYVQELTLFWEALNEIR
ncbi:nucleotidyltransferase substrate binding protein, HI0074 family [Salinibacillus kushneri]|uniref:Nucleotidyltransferase substrate binding protein, HI0074 family n=1 Tax=Salinibacillus kushneri TaxID=237682 RepID=A0A1I0F188_9BACI|nr:nucleotidyltransferase substrate binding protein [Salinibacillus kushneri]SET51761.1 nucleotidyltransferase substrate binding protein, HI0074 family [Salinibacillus kushneri]